MKKVHRYILGIAVITAFAVGVPAAQTPAQTAKPAPQTAKPPAPAPAAATAAAPQVDPKVTSPKAEWGHNVGDDYFLANYQQLIAYWNKLARESNRIHISEIGK